MKIVILDKKTVTEGDISLEAIESLGEVKVYNLTSKEEIMDHVGDAEIVLCNKVVLHADAINSCKNLKMIGVFATGYNNVDLEAAKKRGIVVCNAPAYSTDSVAQHVFAFLLHIMNKIATYDNDVHERKWINSDTFTYFPHPITEIAGLTMGIIGYGSIGRKVAGIAKAFGMKVIVYTRTPKNDLDVEFVTEDEIFTKSDILSIHCPLTDETRGLVDMINLKKMKPTAILINTARGPVVEEEALAEALNQGMIAGAGIDVLSREPMRADNPLLGAKNCVITPHIAWAPKQARERLISIVADNIKHYIDENPINVVNP